MARLPNSQHLELHSAMVCGARLPAGETLETFRTTGLLHLVVVSGSHFIWLDALLRMLLGHWRRANFVIIPALCVFAMATQLEAPIVRAGFSMILAAIGRRAATGWSPLQVTAISGLVSLAAFPVWFRSLSLLLSWTAALALAYGPPRESPWKRQIRLYLCLLICLLPLQPPHPLTIPINVIAAPILGFVLFPLSGLVWLLPSLAGWIDPVFTLALHLLEFSARQVPTMHAPNLAPKPWMLWLLLFSLNGIWISLEIRNRRRQ